MHDLLDHDLKTLKILPTDAGPVSVETAVFERIARIRDARSAAQAFLPVRAAAVIAALGFGLAGGGFVAAAAASERQEISAFAIDAHLAPSTLLDGR